MSDFSHPERLLPLTSTLDWMQQFVAHPIDINKNDYFSFSKRDREGNKHIYHGFHGALIFSSLITTPCTPIHMRHGIKIGKGRMVFDFPIEQPSEIHIGIALYSRKNSAQTHFMTLVAQDTANPENCMCLWVDYLDGELSDLFIELNEHYVDVPKFRSFLQHQKKPA